MEGLQSGAQQMTDELGAPTCSRLIEFIELLCKWNRVHNLTSVDEPGKILTHHLLDSLSAASFISGPNCLDVESGAGFPGVVMAICFPQQNWTLAESKSKKAGFLREVKAHIGVENLAIFEGRVENYPGTVNFDTLTARAVTSLAGLLQMTGHLHHPMQRLIAMKGAYPHDELEALSPEYRGNTEVFPVTVPGLSARRHIVKIRDLTG